MKKTKKESYQKAFDYALFMISSSYFDRQPKTGNPYMEKKLFLYYMDRSYKEQIEMEEMCIKYMENELIPILPADIWHTFQTGENDKRISSNCLFVPDYKTGVCKILYETAAYTLWLSGEYQGRNKNPVFTYELKKTSPLLLTA